MFNNIHKKLYNILFKKIVIINYCGYMSVYYNNSNNIESLRL
jgi:hypothetical protein